MTTNFTQIVVFALQYEQFYDLAKLMDIEEIFLASSADCEKGFRHMNATKNKIRNRLGECHLNMPMRVKSYQSYRNSIHVDSIYQE